jgi:hypothetical protein
VGGGAVRRGSLLVPSDVDPDRIVPRAQHVENGQQVPTKLTVRNLERLKTTSQLLVVLCAIWDLDSNDHEVIVPQRRTLGNADIIRSRDARATSLNR